MDVSDTDDLDREPGEPRPGPMGGLLKSLSQVFATLIAIVQTRLELLTNELQEEIRGAAMLLVWAFVALFSAGIGLFLGALAIIFAFWETHRVLVSVIVTLVFFAISLFAYLMLVNKVQKKPRLLEGTLAELARDGERLKRR